MTGNFIAKGVHSGIIYAEGTREEVNRQLIEEYDYKVGVHHVREGRCFVEPIKIVRER